MTVYALFAGTDTENVAPVPVSAFIFAVLEETDPLYVAPSLTRTAATPLTLLKSPLSEPEITPVSCDDVSVVVPLDPLEPHADSPTAKARSMKRFLVFIVSSQF